ncbi:MAG TPA: hypothetical protein ENF16_00335 [Bacteroidetes bacterium]|nr:hypothetical protein [Bacteroidota bacterium]
MKCPPLQMIEDYLSGELPAEDRIRLEEHLESCVSCRKVLSRERELDDLLRYQPILKAPEGLYARIMSKLPAQEKTALLPDCLTALAFGLLLAFGGFMVGKFATPLIGNLAEKIAAFRLDPEMVAEIDRFGLLSQGDWFSQLSSGGNIIIVNLIVGGIILCWGLWQMVKALRG